MVNLVFHLKSDEGHIERFSFDVYMSPLPIVTKIKHPFAWHISFLVRHLSKYSVPSPQATLILGAKFSTPLKLIFFVSENLKTCHVFTKSHTSYYWMHII